MSSRRRRQGPSLASYVGLVRFYEEMEGLLRLNPYLIVVIAVTTSIIIILSRIIIPMP
ncbi:MAG: preprotein translocase subunit Sec61beta [Ignisphaera sp.]|nr:preprotein translocase subunit Sec61beta [Ignisphaera sp.]MCX8167993.1 preprotein translocase subunit Sec61beta [Ignisphaera sp.]MDW8085536.1 preprotein translocase subunit Sec61beta [Ignisphaera sp.]